MACKDCSKLHRLGLSTPTCGRTCVSTDQAQAGDGGAKLFSNLARQGVEPGGGNVKELACDIRWQHQNPSIGHVLYTGHMSVS